VRGFRILGHPIASGRYRARDRLLDVELLIRGIANLVVAVVMVIVPAGKILRMRKLREIVTRVAGSPPPAPVWRRHHAFLLFAFYVRLDLRLIGDAEWRGHDLVDELLLHFLLLLFCRHLAIRPADRLYG
jgi:hypothetical protein